jgi:hypothetical protein
MKPADPAITEDPLDALIDLSRDPQAGDDRRATALEACVQSEMRAAAGRGDQVWFEHASKRARAALHYRSLICELITPNEEMAA